MPSGFTWYGERLEQEIMGNVRGRLEKLGADMKRDIKASMKPGKYRPWPSRGTPGTIHWSSSPGPPKADPPAPDTGDLKESIDYEVHKIPGGYVLNIGSIGSKAVEYAIYMEEKGGPHTAPRPFLRPIFENYRNKIITYIKLSEGSFGK